VKLNACASPEKQQQSINLLNFLNLSLNNSFSLKLKSNSQVNNTMLGNFYSISSDAHAGNKRGSLF